MDEQDLHGMAAIVTGGSSEIAGAVAQRLAREGVQVCLCGERTDLLELAAAPVRNMGGTCLTLATPLDSLEEAQSVMEQARAAFGRLDILVLVSPFWAGGHIHEHSMKAWDLVLAANVRQPFLMARAVLPVFRAQRHGEVLAIGSDSAQGFYERDGAYGVAMHALTALMKLIEVENAGVGIRTQLLSPGVAQTVDTDSEGKPALTVSHVADWAVWLLTRPAHLRGNGPIVV
jgi:NAD(P)-dependent dehydrogenase (short-subunit alcohol dehydrogenase family)